MICFLVCSVLRLAYDFALSLVLQRNGTTHFVSQQRQRERAIIGHARFSFVTEILFHLSASLSFLPPSCPGAAHSCHILGKIMHQLRTLE